MTDRPLTPAVAWSDDATEPVPAAFGLGVYAVLLILLVGVLVAWTCCGCVPSTVRVPAPLSTTGPIIVPATQPAPVIIHEEPLILELHLYPNPPVRIPWCETDAGAGWHEGRS